MATDLKSSNPIELHALLLLVPMLTLQNDEHFNPKWLEKSPATARNMNRVASLG